MSLCDMNPHQVIGYVNAWAVAITVIVSGLIRWAIHKPLDAFREQEAYARGVADTEARYAPKSLYLGLSDYDAQRPEGYAQEVTPPINSKSFIGAAPDARGPMGRSSAPWRSQ